MFFLFVFSPAFNSILVKISHACNYSGCKFLLHILNIPPQREACKWLSNIHITVCVLSKMPICKRQFLDTLPHSEPKLMSKIQILNSLAPGKFEWNFRYVIFKWILVVDGWGISCEIALISMSLDFADDQSTLVQVMAWCRQATSHYLSQCWPRSLSLYGVTRPQWVKWPCNFMVNNKLQHISQTNEGNFHR